MQEDGCPKFVMLQFEYDVKNDEVEVSLVDTRNGCKLDWENYRLRPKMIHEDLKRAIAWYRQKMAYSGVW